MSGTVGDNVARASGVIASAGGGGKILQVVQYVSTAHSVSSTSSTFVDMTGFEVAITPTAESSKILVMMNFHGSAGGSLVIKLQRDIASGGYTDVFVGDADGSRSQASAGTGAGAVGGTLNIQDKDAIFLDSPSYTLTDEITYKTQWLQESSATAMCLNRSTGNTNFIYVPVVASSMTAIEIAA